jgi:hypothetical protein
MKKKFTQYDGLHESTRTCPCSASVTWSRLDDGRLAGFMKAHAGHVEDKAIERTLSEDLIHETHSSDEWIPARK